MSAYRIEIRVTPRPGLLDPEGNAVEHALHSLGFDAVEEIRVGKAIYMNVEAGSEEEAREQVDAMCRQVLANPVTEDYRIDVLGPATGGGEGGGPDPAVSGAGAGDGGGGTS